jgi:hypothetical protein
MPVRWMAPESLADPALGVWTAASDVYSFGVLLWEVYSLATMPHASIASADVSAHVIGGNRLQPIACSEPM